MLYFSNKGLIQRNFMKYDSVSRRYLLWTRTAEPSMRNFEIILGSAQGYLRVSENNPAKMKSNQFLANPRRPKTRIVDQRCIKIELKFYTHQFISLINFYWYYFILKKISFNNIDYFHIITLIFLKY